PTQPPPAKAPSERHSPEATEVEQRDRDLAEHAERREAVSLRREIHRLLLEHLDLATVEAAKLDDPSLRPKLLVALRRIVSTLEELISFGALTEQMGRFLTRSVIAKKNVVISGGTGSGKTTLLNVLSAAIPSDERIVTIEDAAELQLRQPHVVSLETRPQNM